MSATNKVIGIAVGLLMAAIIFPLAMTTLLAANHTGVNATVWTVVSVLVPILAVIAIALYFLPKAGGN